MWSDNHRLFYYETGKNHQSLPTTSKYHTELHQSNRSLAKIMKHYLKRLKPLFITVSLAALTAILVIGCGSSTQTPQASGSPKTESPAKAPSISITNERTAKSGGGGNEGRFAKVKIDKLENYKHPTGLFSMDIPAGWTKQDTSKPDEIIIAWTDPAKNSLIIMDVFEVEGNPNKSELGSKLKEFISGLFGKQPQFNISDAQEQPDGTMRVEWSYEVTVQNSKGILLGNSFIEKKDNKVAVFSVAMPKNQFNDLKANFNKVISSRQIDPKVNIGS